MSVGWEPDEWFHRKVCEPQLVSSTKIDSSHSWGTNGNVASFEVQDDTNFRPPGARHTLIEESCRISYSVNFSLVPTVEAV